VVLDAPPPAVETAIAGRRVSLDVFRGATILGMILVNNPGTWSAIYAPLRHAAWHGWTPTDLVFPFFLFIVGVAIPMAFERRLALGAPRGDLLRKTLRRAAVLFLIGLGMAAYGRVWGAFAGEGLGLADLRIMGVLQRIALCYLAAAALFLFTSARTRLALSAALLLGYWAVLMLVPVPGAGAGQIDTPELTLAAYVDRLLLGGHLWAGADGLWDPEGLLSTLPAIVTTLLGVEAGRLLRRGTLSPTEHAVRLLVAGAALTAVGAMWGWAFPINKALWTSSYVLLTGGLACTVLGVCIWVVDVRGWRRWAHPFVVYGVNALLVFVASGLLARTLTLIHVPGGRTLQAWIFETLFAPVGPPEVASLLYALTWVGAWYLVLLALYRRGIVWKV
jgi:predicted acyltransferase